MSVARKDAGNLSELTAGSCGWQTGGKTSFVGETAAFGYRGGSSLARDRYKFTWPYRRLTADVSRDQQS